MAASFSQMIHGLRKEVRDIRRLGPIHQDAVVAAGHPILVTGRWSGARGPVLATLLRDGAPIAAAPARIDRHGALRAELRRHPLNRPVTGEPGRFDIPVEMPGRGGPRDRHRPRMSGWRILPR